MLPGTSGDVRRREAARYGRSAAILQSSPVGNAFMNSCLAAFLPDCNQMPRRVRSSESVSLDSWSVPSRSSGTTWTVHGETVSRLVSLPR